MKNYRCVFFDLDHTLWDYEKNSKETLVELYNFHQIDRMASFSFEQFYHSFQRVNIQLWEKYDRGLIDRNDIRSTRFPKVLALLNYTDNELSGRLSEHYHELSPTKKSLIPHAIEVLDYLVSRYSLYLVTNGFDKMQTTKVNSGGIRHYFKDVMTSERAGFKKPEKEIFELILQQNGYTCHEAIMIGDNLLTDIAGANNAGIDSVFYNPNREPHSGQASYEIASLIDLKSIL